MKKYYFFGIIGLIVLLLAGFFIFTAEETSDNGAVPAPSGEGAKTSADAGDQTAPQPSGSQTSPKSGLTKPSSSGATSSKNQGRIIFALKDEFVSLDQIDSILFTINEIQVQNPSKGWITVMSGSKVFDLIKIYKSGSPEFLSEVNIDPGAYTQLRISAGPIRIVRRGSSVSEEAKLPSGELKIPARISVAKGENSSVEIDILSEKSIHTATDGKYIFLPVLRVETKSNVTSFQVRQNIVTIIGGAGMYDATYGMDENGILKDGYRLSPAAKLEIVDDKIKIIPQ